MEIIPARNYTPGRIKPIQLLVIHDMESPERLDTAEAVARYFAGSNAPRASTHYNIDSDSVVQSVKDSDTAWCAPGANANGLHFEHAGFARQSRSEWLDDYGMKMLKLSADLVGSKAKQYGIPIKRLTPLEIRGGKSGIVGHWDVTKAFPDKGSHTDPGANFPWDHYFDLMGSGRKPSTPQRPSLPVDGLLGPKTISAWQKVMGTPVDGVISRPSLLIREVQRRLKVNTDGNLGPITTRALQRRMGTPVDGVISRPSLMVKELQRRLSRGTW